MTVRRARNWVVHDYLQVNGGAERLAITLARNLPDCRLAVSGIYPAFAASGNVDGVEREVLGAGWLPRIPRALRAFSRKDHAFLRAAECVIYSGIYAPLAATAQGGGRRVYYCHTPPRFAFDERDAYLRRVPAALRPMLRLAISTYRRAYLSAIRAMDVVMTNSLHVRERLLGQTGVEARVVYPPVDTHRFRFLGQQDYYLSVARLEPYKRVDRIVRAFLSMPDKRLVVASGGSQLEALRSLAGGASNIRFAGWIDDTVMARLVGDAIAVIYVPRDEDFGISAVEAMAAGKPVIGVDAGGLRESVIDGHTGAMLAPDPGPEAIAAAVRRMTAGLAARMRPACEERARGFSEAAFVSAFRELIG